MKSGSLPLKPRSYRSLTTPYFRVVLYSFSKSRKIAIRCCFFYKGFPDEGLQVDQMVLISSLSLESVLRLVIRPLDSRYHNSLLFIICSIVSQKQLVNAMDG